MPDHPVEVVVLLGTSFARLEGQGTRWRFVLREWAQDPRVRRLVAVDFPKLSPRHLAGSELAVRRASWLEGCELLEARVPVHRRSALGAGLAWRRTGRAVSDLLGPARTTRLVLATTPLSAPLLVELPSDQVGFDAVDDWRELPGVAHLRTHVARGYRCLPAGATSTSVSSGLAETLRRDFSLTPVAVPNGVDLAP